MGSASPGGPGRSGPGPGSGPIGLVRIEEGRDAFELVHPSCVRESQLDYEEGLELWSAGDPEEARDALRFALEACRDNLWIHAALGRLALEEFKDLPLARGHFGYAVELVKKAIPTGFQGHLPCGRQANAPLYQAAEGLIRCFLALGRQADARDLESFLKTLETPPRAS